MGVSPGTDSRRLPGRRKPTGSSPPPEASRSSTCTCTRTSRSWTAAAASRSWSPARPSWGSRPWPSPTTTASTAPSASPRPAPGRVSMRCSGCEVGLDPLADTAEAAPTPEQPPYHLVLLAETREGYANLCRLLSAAHLADPERDRPPTVTLDPLRAHRRGAHLPHRLPPRRGRPPGRRRPRRRRPPALLALRDDLRRRTTSSWSCSTSATSPTARLRPAQDGTTVYQKVRGDDGRLRHRATGRRRRRVHCIVPQTGNTYCTQLRRRCYAAQS